VGIALAFALTGLAAGAAYAGLGGALVALHRGTGVLNFALGAIAMWAAYVYDELRKSGNLVLPLGRVHLGGDVPALAAALLGVCSAAAIGALVYLLVFRALRRAPALAAVAASVGLMMALQATATLRFGSEQRVVEPLLSGGSATIGGLAVPWDRFELAGLAVLAAAGLWAYHRFTRIGIATRAAAENERGALLAGLSPDLLAGTAWTLSAALAALFGILLAPVTGLNPVNFTLLVVPALAVALLGRLRSFGATCAAGLVLGMVQAELVYAQTQSWYPRWAVTGATDALPFLVILVTLVVLGGRLPARGSLGAVRLPAAARPQRVLAPVLALAAGGTVALLLLHGSERFGLIQSTILATVMLSIVVLTGFVGQISLAQAALAGVGGFALSKLAGTWGVPFPLSPLLAALAATAFGVVVGLPAVRIRGAQLAVVTLAAAVAIERFVFNNPSLTPFEGNLIPSPHALGLDLGVRSGSELVRVPFGLLALAVLVAAVAVVATLLRGAVGRRFLAVRSNERAAAAAGVDVAATKLQAFALSSFLAGLGGALIGYSRGQLSADSFGVFTGLSWLVFAYLGGIASIGGALVGAALAPLGIGYVLLDRTLHLGKYYLLVSGLSLIAVTLVSPEGIVGSLRRRRAGAGERTPASPLLRGRARRAQAGAAASRTPLAPAVPPTPSTPSTPWRRLRARPAPQLALGRPASLELERLTVAYGANRAVDDVSLRVEAGAIAGLIGPNGAGKTSLIDAVTGFTPCRGTMRLDGRSLDGLAPHRRARLGLARTWQSAEPFADLTLGDSLHVAAGGEAAVAEILELVGLDGMAERLPHELSLGERKLAGVARALAGGPRVLALDEPAAGLDAAESRLLGVHIRALAERGVTIVLIDHDTQLVFDVCDPVHVLDVGRLIASGPPAQVRTDAAVVAAYLGHAPAAEESVA
jgi:ABC-type branched-subunit amino acid transport system ATPase component/ABC-type branched-subunit amino acid transport system permease subunit